MENVATNKQVDELFLFSFESTVDTTAGHHEKKVEKGWSCRRPLTSRQRVWPSLLMTPSVLYRGSIVHIARIAIVDGRR